MTAVAFRIVRLQIQVRPMKVGKAPMREYRPEALQPVERIMITPRGGEGAWRVDGAVQRAFDVHHQDHPLTRNPKGTAGVTVMGTGDYVELRKQYGDHVADGIAGESVLIEAPEGLAEQPFPTEFKIITADGVINFGQGRIAEPCVEFSRFCLRERPSPQVSDAVRRALVDLDNGHRGYRAAARDSGRIAIGDTVVLDLA
ncbi:MAG TPA: hypothetical protein VIP98_18435 [Microlunatus sp.]